MLHYQLSSVGRFVGILLGLEVGLQVGTTDGLFDGTDDGMDDDTVTNKTLTFIRSMHISFVVLSVSQLFVVNHLIE